MTSEIRILSVNAFDFDGGLLPWQNAADSFSQSVKASKPDLVAVQGAPNELFSYLSDCLSDDYSCLREQDSQGNNAVLYKNERFNLLEQGSFFLSDTPSKRSRFGGAEQDRICAWAAFEEKGSKIRFFNMNTAPERSLSVLLKCIPLILTAGAKYDVPTILTGDFACAKGSYTYKALTSAVFKDACETCSAGSQSIADKAMAYIKNLTAASGGEYIFVNHLAEPVKCGKSGEILLGESAGLFDGVYADINLLSRK